MRSGSIARLNAEKPVVSAHMRPGCSEDSIHSNTANEPRPDDCTTRAEVAFVSDVEVAGLLNKIEAREIDETSITNTIIKHSFEFCNTVLEYMNY